MTEPDEEYGYRYILEKGECLWRKLIKKKISTNFDAFYKDLEKEYIKDLAFLEDVSGGYFQIVDGDFDNPKSERAKWHINLNLYPRNNEKKPYSRIYEFGETARETLLYILNYVIGIEKHLFQDEAKKKFDEVNK